ncbi:MAG: protein kinase [Gemmatimonadota bacterium]|nr:protein kinase [Gemmatimonadota bacterium]
MSDDVSRLRAALTGRYEIERELGHGGMATVYLAKDLRHSRVVAIKVLNRELAQAVGGDRFIREISFAAQLQHPHILTLIDSGEADGFLYYVMPYASGESLRSRLARDGALPASEATRLFREIIDALAHAHKHGMIHRDIKPDNVMISDRHALVVDFGVAKAMGDAKAEHSLTTAGMSLGTPAYMAPEQIAAEADVDQRADIYSAGIVAYEMLAGKPPFSGNAQQLMSAHMVTPPPPLATVQPSVPPAIERIVMRCLEKQRDARYQTADDLLAELESLSTPSGTTIDGDGFPKPAGKKRIAAMIAAGVVIAAGATYAFTSSGGGTRWVRAEAIPQIQRYVESGANDSAFLVATKAEKEAPDDSILNSLWPQFTRKISIRTEPAGATVYRAMFTDTTRWETIGTTPFDSVRIPAGPSVTRIRVEKEGYRTANRIFGPYASQLIVLDRDNAPNPEMVRIAGGEFSGALPGLDALKPIEMSDYLIDRYETTNRDYKTFVDAGGYTKPEYWETEFFNDGRKVSFAEAVTLFIDKTGRPGPSTWEAGDYPSGQADLPVGGVSWYEAAAYAKFAGKSLPTMYHWARAATVPISAYIVPGSNFRRQGPERAGASSSMSGFGVYDMAGNVREWCYNEENRGRYILGGGWNDPTYQFNDAYTQPPFDRSPINGIRLVKYLKAEPGLRLAMQPLVRRYRDYSREKPVGDAEFKTFLTLYDYDPLPLEAKLESRDSVLDYAIREKITFTAAYANERVTAFLFLPKNGKPPYQTVVYFPGSNAIYARTSANLEIARIDFLVKSGRAVMYPIYKSTYERADSLKSDYSDETVFYRDHVVMWGKDLRRSIDYLETRRDIDSAKIGYFGLSWGGFLGGIMPAVEPRIKAVVLYIAGLSMDPARPEADVINFLPRVKQPVIMLNGKHDHFFPVETSQKPFFRMLGAPADRKRYVLYEGGHFVPRTQLIAESLSWLDKYLGPVR